MDNTLLLRMFSFTDIVFVVLLFIISLIQWQQDIWHFLGFTIAAIGFSCWIISRYQLGTSFSLGAKPNKLVTRGLYRHIRHPIYTFSIMTFIGFAGMFLNKYFSIAVILLIFIQVSRSKIEEKVLTNKYGSKYINYKKSTLW